MAATFLVSVRLLPQGPPAPIDESDSEPNLEVASIHDVTDAPAIP